MHTTQHYYFTLLFLHTILPPILSLFFFNAPATTEIYTLSLHDALPICKTERFSLKTSARQESLRRKNSPNPQRSTRSEEHTSELQSRFDLVCRLLLEKKKKKKKIKQRLT